MTIRAWEFGLFLFGGFFALLFFLVDSPLLGVGVGSAVAVGMAARLRPIGRRGVAGGHARQQAWLEAVQTFGIAAVLTVATVLMFIASRERWSSDFRGMVAVLALAGLIVMLLVELNRRADKLVDWVVGAQAEEAVRGEIADLSDAGWVIRHNVEKDFGGNIDHVAIATTGVFAIETKSGPYRPSAVSQAIGAAMALRAMTGVSWVTAVVCVQGGGEPRKRGSVWIVPRVCLRDWLLACREHRGAPVDVATADARLRQY